MPNEDNNFYSSLVLDFRKWWRHVQAKNRLYYLRKEFNMLIILLFFVSESAKIIFLR